ncbi:late competence development ComFB family protein [Desulfovibrio aminophilus]|uniref:late competence development ComFB family protein n=1 Tax=Desulfovibrio aminophilus TaxID=81425 RepID=UPI003394E4EF
MRGTKRRMGYEDLENVAEDMVLARIASLAEDESLEFCRCPVCLQDMAAIVLNRVPPLYCCSLLEKNSPGEDFSRRVDEVRERIEEELPRALELVRSHDNH